MVHHRASLFSFVLISLFGLSNLLYATPEHAAKLEFFETKIRPALIEHCYECHSEEAGKDKGGLLLDSRAAWMLGGDSGAAILPGNADNSPLFEAISRTGTIPEMPPKSHLPDEVIADFRRWIEDGAIDPREGDAPVHERETIDIEAGRQHWSFQPRRELPIDTTIDSLVQPSQNRADGYRMARRLYLDLTGLPPTNAELQTFVAVYQAQPKQAVAELAAELLARHSFGEKWARHWLDIARYADSNGGDFNKTYPQAWRYRNYVIDAFNADMPYDQFLREQLAGDLLPHGSPTDRDRQLVATGYLMVAPKMLTERNKAKMHLDIADEQIDTIGRSLMGLTLGCARCHDHKFDPIPTADYYAMTGILHSTRTADAAEKNRDVSHWDETGLSIDAALQKQVDAHRASLDTLKAEIKAQEARIEQLPEIGQTLDNDKAKQTGAWSKSTHRPDYYGSNYLTAHPSKGKAEISWQFTIETAGQYEVRIAYAGGGSGLDKKAPYRIQHADGAKELKIDQSKKPPIRDTWLSLGQYRFEKEATISLTNHGTSAYIIADAVQLIPVSDADKDTGERGEAEKQLTQLQKKLKDQEGKAPKLPMAMAAADLLERERFGDLAIRIRGEVANLGPIAERGFLQVAYYPGQPEPEISDKESGRLQMADWIVHPDHPLTARVMANRVWQHLFGKGIVETVDNFGLLGAEPTHPELLDYLATRLVENDWSIKALISEIVTSDTYQQAARTATDDDPSNSRLQHQNRRPAPAETIRDSILAIAGQLDSERQLSTIAHLGRYAIETSGKRDASLGKLHELRHRAIYLPVVRGALPPTLAIFDMANPDLVTGQRAATNVPSQALYLMNSPLVIEMSELTSKNLLKDDPSIETAITRAYLTILCRKPSSGDLALAQQYIESTPDGLEAGMSSLVQVLFGSAEFRFIE